ncbi:MAG TPA: SAM-dependent methyltransferase [Polyangiaceae bacterium]|jgi:methyltransferase (TIGR00027 family)|nr:SAM-dependent methyltransferase [Polyangiaceae bacterium]
MDARQTAAAIARVRKLEGTRPAGERLFEDPYAALFEDTTIDVQQLFDMIPFFEEHIRVRTRFFDDAARSAVARGARFVVLVGAGFDTRVFRMPELRPPVRVIEVDHEDQLAGKRQKFAAAGVALPDNLSYASADLLEQGALARGLAGAGLREPAVVLWICEGLLGYLSLPAITELGTAAAALSAPGSTLVANHNVYSWSPAALAGVFSRSGWKVSPAPSFNELHRKWIAPGEIPAADEFALLVVNR